MPPRSGQAGGASLAGQLWGSSDFSSVTCRHGLAQGALSRGIWWKVPRSVSAQNSAGKGWVQLLQGPQEAAQAWQPPGRRQPRDGEAPWRPQQRPRVGSRLTGRQLCRGGRRPGSTEQGLLRARASLSTAPCLRRRPRGSSASWDLLAARLGTWPLAEPSRPRPSPRLAPRRPPGLLQPMLGGLLHRLSRRPCPPSKPAPPGPAPPSTRIPERLSSSQGRA